jgi:hypothetical protein
MRPAGAAWLLLAIVFGCDAESTAAGAVSPVPIGPGDGILFVGNSLTYGNDLPGLVEGLSAGTGGRLQTAMVAFPGYSLADHFSKGDAIRSIATGGWRVVILQQGPSTLPESQDLLRRFTASFDRRIRPVGARTALFSVWPDTQFPSTFEDVAESYSLAAADVGGIYLPVTQAWQLAFQRQPALRLYSSDGFHPSEQGSYLAALVMVGVLTGRSPLGMPARVVRPAGTEVSIPQEVASVLQDAASAAIAAYARH